MGHARKISPTTHIVQPQTNDKGKNFPRSSHKTALFDDPIGIILDLTWDFFFLQRETLYISIYSRAIRAFVSGLSGEHDLINKIGRLSTSFGIHPLPM